MIIDFNKCKNLKCVCISDTPNMGFFKLHKKLVSVFSNANNLLNHMINFLKSSFNWSKTGKLSNDFHLVTFKT